MNKTNKEKQREYQRTYKRTWRKKNPEKQREIAKNDIIRARIKFIEMYGGKCTVCGEIEPLFLTIDHVNNDGYKSSHRNGGSGPISTLYKAIKKIDVEKYQILCFNCNYNKYHRIIKEKEHSRHPTSIRTRNYYKNIKKKFIELYGGKCSCCGENRIEFLTMDHIQNDGCDRRRYNDNKSELVDAVKNYNPERYQILCFNCNIGRNRNGGECPHKNTANKSQIIHISISE